jgi:hypothetical protein
MIQGDLDALTGIVGIGVGLGLGVTAVRPPIPILAPISVCLVLMAVVMYPLLSTFVSHRELKNLDVEQVARAYRLLGQRPNNPLAQAKLAESVYRLGMAGHAVAIAEDALKKVSERAAFEEYRQLRRWKSAGIPADTMKPISCVECHTPCPPGWTHCRTCGAQFLLDRARGRLLPTGSARKLVAGWIVVALVTVGGPIVPSLPRDIGIVLAIGLLVASVGVLAIAFRPVEAPIV